mmetsp:Transcript_60925/g.191569  ORF Transcript_60925/g.191569 Transcript_60925/m.191569 type:complete len:211 (-) Transcript_60925:382-1014(-)
MLGARMLSEGLSTRAAGGALLPGPCDCGRAPAARGAATLEPEAGGGCSSQPLGAAGGMSGERATGVATPERAWAVAGSEDHATLSTGTSVGAAWAGAGPMFAMFVVSTELADAVSAAVATAVGSGILLGAVASGCAVFTGVTSGAPSCGPSAWPPSCRSLPEDLRRRGVSAPLGLEVMQKFSRDCSTSASIMASCSEVRSRRCSPISCAS